MQSLADRLAMEQERVRLLIGSLYPRAAAPEGVAPDPDGLLARFTQLARCLRHCLRLEEETLFPAVERAYPGQPTTRSLRGEHALIRELLVEIERGLRSGNHRGVAFDLRELEHTLELHFAKLGSELLPLIELLLEAGNPALEAALQPVPVKS